MGGKLSRRVFAVLKAYVVSDLVRSSGFLFGALSMMLWILLLILPLALFAPSDVEVSELSSYAFTGLLIYVFFTTASWDWGAEIRFMINDGRLEYFIASGAGFLPHYLGILPVSLMWIGISLALVYAVLSFIWSPPVFHTQSPALFALGLALLVVSLIGYGLLLGGTMITSGTGGVVVELLSFILPVASGGLTPLKVAPEPLKLFALATPFSYPAELIRYSLLGVEPVLTPLELITVGSAYVILFLGFSVIYFRHQLKKVMREGFRATAMW